MAAKPKSREAPPRGTKAKTMADLAGVLDEMKAVYRDARHGKIPAGTATKFIYVLREVRETMEISAIEARLKGIENRMGR